MIVIGLSLLTDLTLQSSLVHNTVLYWGLMILLLELFHTPAATKSPVLRTLNSSWPEHSKIQNFCLKYKFKVKSKA